MTRVLGLVTFRIYPPLMGGQKGVALFYGHLKKFAGVALALSTNNERPDDGFLSVTPVLYSNKLVFLNLFRSGVLKKLAQAQRIDVVVAEHSYAGWVAWLLKKRTGIPFIIHSYNLEAQRFKHMKRWWWWLYEQYEKWIHRQADFNFFISDDDNAVAVRQFNLKSEKCATITYGVAPFRESGVSRNAFRASIGLDESVTLLFFNGTLDYKPNYEAVRYLGTEVVPRLKTQLSNFKIIISGNRMSQRLHAFIKTHPNLMYLDYVPDVAVIYQCAQLFINPICNNTGVKTKVIEAIANHCTVVSTEAGASGIFRNACGSKLVTVADGDWAAFANCIAAELQKPPQSTPDAFFETYLWDNIARKAAQKIAGVAQ